MKKRCALLIPAIFLLVCASAALADDWASPWSEVEEAVIQRCTVEYEKSSARSICVDTERNCHEKMQGDFGMPSAVAEEAKHQCGLLFKSFCGQVTCMENAASDYEKKLGHEIEPLPADID